MMADDPDDPILTVNDFWPPCCPPGMREFFNANAAVIGCDWRGFHANGARASAIMAVADARGQAATREAVKKHKLRAARNG